MANGLLIENARIMTPTGLIERGWLLCRDTKIAAMEAGIARDIESAEKVDANGLILLPGFIDIHVHGALGHDTMDASEDGLHEMARFFARHGTTSFLATTWTDSAQRIEAALQMVSQIQGRQPGGASLIGVHLEGPYLNPEKCGAQNIDYIRRAEREEALRFLDSGVIRLVSLAPEYEANHWLIEECVRRGITVSAAHTSATFDEFQKAAELGLSHTTHTYNAMPGLHHRDPGTLGAAMVNPDISCELIADNIHVHPAAMKVLWMVKKPSKLVLISDAIRAAGMPDGNYQIDERPIKVANGAVRLLDGTLAGSTLTLDRALKNFMAATQEPLTEVWQTVSLNPACAIGLGDQKGSLEVGKDADLVLVNDDIQIRLTIAQGRICV